MNHLLEISAKLIKTAPLAATLLLGSCSLMHDDLPDCAVAPDVCAAVNFIYDYNTEETDRFHDHVGSVTLYVFDAQGRLYRTIEHTASADELHAEGYEMRLDLPAGTYKLYASAREHVDGYDAAMAGDGAKFRRSGSQTGCRPEDITYSLDHQEGNVLHQNLPLEHLWLTHEPQTLSLPIPVTPAEGEPQPDDIIVRATVPLTRVSNNIRLELTRGEDVLPTSLAAGAQTRAQDINEGEYIAWIGTADGRHELDLLGNTTQGALPLTYTPHSTVKSTLDNGDPALVSDFSTSRLIYNSNSQARDMLYVKSIASGKTFSFDLPEYLARGNEAYAGRGWSKQEYLDREYDYNIRIEFNEDDTEWRFFEIKINILNWAKRIQNVSL